LGLGTWDLGFGIWDLQLLMPEGDTIVRAARALNETLAGRTVTHFESVFSRIARADDNLTIRGRTIERVDARGKHLLIWFSGDVVLRTHMRMHGVWHLYPRGARWRRPHFDMRVVIRTPEYEAVAFNVPVAELTRGRDLERRPAVRTLGPDILAEEFDAADAAQRIAMTPEVDIAEALLNQHAVAGIGNIFKCEALYAAGLDPFTRVADLSREDLARVVEKARRLMRASVAGRRMAFSVYGRGGRPCRRCGAVIVRRKSGDEARVTCWCPRCQAPRVAANARTV
jgi:endonuclease VIII